MKRQREALYLGGIAGRDGYPGLMCGADQRGVLDHDKFCPAHRTGNRLRNLQDTVGYLGDRLRVARDLRTNLTVDGVSCTLTPACGAAPCFAVVVTEAQQVGTAEQYDANTALYLVYRLIPRSQLTGLDKTPDSWADSNTLALVESRVVVCSPYSPALPCSTASRSPHRQRNDSRYGAGQLEHHGNQYHPGPRDPGRGQRNLRTFCI